MAILFYKLRDPFGCFSNFSRYPVAIFGRIWPTSEHAFQAMKFWPDQSLMSEVQQAPTPKASADMGRDRSKPLRKDWEEPPDWYLQQEIKTALSFPAPDDLIIRPNPPEPLFARTKDVIMYQVCQAKVKQHLEIQADLRKTGSEPIIEDSAVDSYWGWGSSKQGQNKLGRIFMLLRAELG